MALYTYSTLALDPLTQFDLHWMDDGATAGTEPNVYYRKKGASTWIEWQGDLVYRQMTNSSGRWYYWCHIDDLEPDSEYEGEIRAGETVKEFEFQTLPRRLWRRPLRVISAQDIHIRRDNVPGAWDLDVTKMDIITAQNPDLWIMGGDWLSTAQTATADNASKHTQWVTDFLPRLNNQGKLVPIFYVPGNHEVGNNTWNGETTSSLADNVQLNQFCFNKEKFNLSVGYYGQIQISNYLNLIGLDTHTEYPSVQGEWLDNNINKDVRAGLAFYHNPMFVVGDRFANDPILGVKCLREWAPALWDAGNVACTFSGNIHTRKATKKLKVKNDNSGDTFPTKDGRHVGLANEGERYFIELGEGWSDNRPLRPDQWFTEYVQSGGRNVSGVVEHYYLVLVSDHSYTVDDIWLDGVTDNYSFKSKRLKEDKRKALMV